MATKEEVLEAMGHAALEADDGEASMPKVMAAALRAADALGWKLVPKEATEEMATLSYGADDPKYYADVWGHMIAAAPSLLDK